MAKPLLSDDQFIHALEARAFADGVRDPAFRLDPARSPRPRHLSILNALKDVIREDWESRRFLLNETCHFFRLNLRHEEALRHQLPALLRDLREPALKRYGRELIAEEEAHSRAMGHFIQDHGGGFPLHPATIGKDEPSLMRLYLFEEILHAFDQSAAGEADLDPLIASLHRRHIEDERRHLAYFRRLVKARFAETDAEGRNRLLQEAAEALEMFWSLFWGEDLFHGLRQPAPADGLKVIAASKAAAGLREKFSRKPLLFLRNIAG